ncbi:hypothetical protein ACGF5C_26300 [Micromonospora sp. NPDC047620]|uniref:hypothetical protein n=1 Tax=Micromonospora sp. NPDC047620 TaxID=3364251 RepID=UPI003713C1E2
MVDSSAPWPGMLPRRGVYRIAVMSSLGQGITVWSAAIPRHDRRQAVDRGGRIVDAGDVCLRPTNASTACWPTWRLTLVTATGNGTNSRGVRVGEHVGMLAAMRRKRSRSYIQLGFTMAESSGG